MEQSLEPNCRATPTGTDIADVQGSADTRRIAIDKIGIKDIRYPVRERAEQHTVASFKMSVYLPHDFKGTHMSRFVQILNNHEREISVDSFKDMLTEMSQLLECEAGHIEMRFPYFVNEKAPVSGVASLLDYDDTFIGEIRHGQPTLEIKVMVPTQTRQVHLLWRYLRGTRAIELGLASDAFAQLRSVCSTKPISLATAPSISPFLDPLVP